MYATSLIEYASHLYLYQNFVHTTQGRNWSCHPHCNKGWPTTGGTRNSNHNLYITPLHDTSARPLIWPAKSRSYKATDATVYDIARTTQPIIFLHTATIGYPIGQPFLRANRQNYFIGWSHHLNIVRAKWHLQKSVHMTRSYAHNMENIRSTQPPNGNIDPGTLRID